MKTNTVFLLAACSGFLSSCAVHVPNELVDARAAHRRVSSGPAAQVAPVELHAASLALAKAEKSFEDDADSYKTRDLAYVAQRKSEIAAATASIATEQKSQKQANADYQTTQGTIADKAKVELSETRTALAASERHGEITAGQLSTAQGAQASADQRVTEAQSARIAADKRAADAQAALAKLASIKEEPRGTVITLSGSVLFASNQAVLLPEARMRLNQVADVLLATRERNVVIEGHTDSQGTDSHNLDLSQNRADAVRSYLVEREYQGDRIKARGLGEGHPIADNNSPEGRANNRRVEIIIERESHTSNP